MITSVNEMKAFVKKNDVAIHLNKLETFFVLNLISSLRENNFKRSSMYFHFVSISCLRKGCGASLEKLGFSLS